MEFNKKLQELRKQKGLTQEELAKALFVSRTAVSKWESGRGYPNIDSMKAIALYFGITVDELLSGGELLNLAEEDAKQKENHFRDLVFGLLDVSAALFLFLPLFGQESGDLITSVSLLSLTEIAPWLKISYFVLIGITVIMGILTLALQNCERDFWMNGKSKISLILNALSICLFTLSRQPYASTFLLVFITIKILILLKKQ